MSSSKKIIPVVAGALMRADGAFMLGSRPEGKPYAGYWEFPGGKVEAGESLFDALVREFHEEMNIHVTHATPWLTRIHHYEHASVELTFFRIWAWQGEPQSCEGQAFAWQMPGHETVSPMLPANGPILKSLSLPAVYVQARLGAGEMDAGLATLPVAAVLVLDVPHLDRAALVRLLQDLAPRAHAHGHLLLARGDLAVLAGLQLDGVHLSADDLAQLETRPDFVWVGTDASSAEELARAAALGLDYAVLATDAPAGQSHSWDAFAAELAAAIPLPVFAAGQGGMDDLGEARRHGAHGVVLNLGVRQ